MPVSSFNEESSKKSSHRMNADIMQHLMALDPRNDLMDSRLSGIATVGRLPHSTSMRKFSQTQTRYYNLRSTTQPFTITEKDGGAARPQSSALKGSKFRRISRDKLPASSSFDDLEINERTVVGKQSAHHVYTKTSQLFVHQNHKILTKKLNLKS